MTVNKYSPCRRLLASLAVFSILGSLDCTKGLSAEVTNIEINSKKDFLEHYEPAYQLLKQHYSNLRLVADRRVSTKEGGSPTRSEVKAFVLNGLLRSDETFLKRQSKYNSIARVVSPRGSFKVGRSDAGARYAITAMRANYQDEYESCKLDHPLLTAPYGVLESDVLDLVSDESTSFVRASLESTVPKVVLCVFERNFIGLNNKPMTQKMLFSFLPDYSWALNSYAIGLKSFSKGSIRYNLSDEQMPRMTSAKFWTEYEAKDEPFGLMEYDVRELIFDDVTEEMFSLVVFGIDDDIMNPPSSRGFASRLLLYSNFAIIIALLFLYYLRKKARRRSRSAP